MCSKFYTRRTLYHVAIPTDVSLLSLSGRRQSRAAGLQRMTRGTLVFKLKNFENNVSLNLKIVVPKVSSC